MPRKHDHNGSRDRSSKQVDMTPSKLRGSRSSSTTSSSLDQSGGGFSGLGDLLMNQGGIVEEQDDDDMIMSGSRMIIDGDEEGEEIGLEGVDLSRPSGYRYRRRQSRGSGIGSSSSPFLPDEPDEEDNDEGDDIHEHHENYEGEEGEHDDDDDDDEDDEDDNVGEGEEEDEHRLHDDDSDHSSNDSDSHMQSSSAGNRIRNVFGALSAGLIMSGFSARIRPILNALKNREDPSAVLMGLQELADNLLISTEDILIGYFPLDEFVAELVRIMRDPLYEDSPEIMLMACRDIANLIEVLPSSVGSIVQTDCIQVLCQKLLEIQYIDLAEQALAVSMARGASTTGLGGAQPPEAKMGEVRLTVVDVREDFRRVSFSSS